MCSFEFIGQLIYAVAYAVDTYIAVLGSHSWYGLSSVNYVEWQVSIDSCLATLAFLVGMYESWYRFCMF